MTLATIVLLALAAPLEAEDKDVPVELAESWKVFRDANASDAELGWAIVALCDSCVGEFEGTDPKPWAYVIREQLVKRRITYKAAYNRQTIVSYLDVIMAHIPEEQLPLIRDALNDSDELVRRSALDALGTWLDAAFDVKGDVRVPWSPAVKERVLVRRDQYVDEVVDVLIGKGLTDTSGSNYSNSMTALQSDHVLPNEPRIRSLRRAIESGMIRNERASQEALELLEAWSPSDRRIKKDAGDDPFAPAR